jgi:hypothetical protein
MNAYIYIYIHQTVSIFYSDRVDQNWNMWTIILLLLKHDYFPINLESIYYKRLWKETFFMYGSRVSLGMHKF